MSPGRGVRATRISDTIGYTHNRNWGERTLLKTRNVTKAAATKTTTADLESDAPPAGFRCATIAATATRPAWLATDITEESAFRNGPSVERMLNERNAYSTSIGTPAPASSIIADAYVVSN